MDAPTLAADLRNRIYDAIETRITEYTHPLDPTGVISDACIAGLKKQYLRDKTDHTPNQLSTILQSINDLDLCEWVDTFLMHGEVNG